MFFKRNITPLKHPKDVQRIKKALHRAGEFEATDLEIEAAWEKFSKEIFKNQWLIPIDCRITRFIRWLETTKI